MLNGALPVFLRDGLGELGSQTLVVTGEMIVSQPPEKMFSELGGEVRSAPGAAGEL